jgi:hypothetical protein
MPRNSVPMMVAITIRVFLALTASGARKAETPLEMASTPVRAVVPEAKARRTRNTVTAPTAPSWVSRWACSGE